MSKIVPGLLLAALLAGGAINVASAVEDTQFVTTVPSDALPVSSYYNEDVYDAQNNKIGDVNDILFEKDGRVSAVIVGVGGFLGVGEKDVAVPFNALESHREGRRPIPSNERYQGSPRKSPRLYIRPG